MYYLTKDKYLRKALLPYSFCTVSVFYYFYCKFMSKLLIFYIIHFMWKTYPHIFYFFHRNIDIYIHILIIYHILGIYDFINFYILIFNLLTCLSTKVDKHVDNFINYLGGLDIYHARRV